MFVGVCEGTSVLGLQLCSPASSSLEEGGECWPRPEEECRAPAPRGCPHTGGSDRQRARRETETEGESTSGSLELSCLLCAFWFCSDGTLISKGSQGEASAFVCPPKKCFPFGKVVSVDILAFKRSSTFSHGRSERWLSLESRAGMFFRVYSCFFLA